MGRPTRSEARDTRQEILDAAMDLFAQNGFAGTSMRQIARAVGVRESALYHHFPSKVSIFEAIVDTYGPHRLELLSSVDVKQLAETGVPEFLRNFASFVFELWDTPKERRWIRLLMSEAPRMAATSQVNMTAFISRAIDAFADLFSRMMDAGLIRKLDPKLLAHQWMAPLMMARLRFMALNPGPNDARQLKQLAEFHAQQFWVSVRPETERTFTQEKRR